MKNSKEVKELLENQIDRETYIEALKATVDDLKMALVTISLSDDIEQANNVALIALRDFHNSDEFIKKTTLQKERERFENLLY